MHLDTPDTKLVLERGIDRLLAMQDADGWWTRCPDANVMVDAVDVFIRELLGVRDEKTVSASARWIRSQQSPDGGWTTYPHGPGDLSTTVEAYLALRLSGDGAELPHMRAAAQFVRSQGGLASCRLEAKIWLALFGQGSWDSVPTVLPEVVLLPPAAPMSLYKFSTWTRLALVPLGLVHDRRPVVDPGFRLDELHAVGSKSADARHDSPSSPSSPSSPPRVARLLDQGARRLNRLSPGPLRRRALRRSIQWILDRQEADGAWLACNVASVFCLLGLYAAGKDAKDPDIRRGLEGLDRFAVWLESPEGPMRRMNCMPTPVWDSALCVWALLDAGLPADHPALLRAADWLAGQEVRAYGDWAVARPGSAAGGWSVGFVEKSYPDCDDTAVVVEALSRVRPEDPEAAATRRGAVNRGINWLLTMQCGDGGWAAYDADNTSLIATKLATLDFTELTDPPCPDITAHALEALAAQGLRDHPRVRQAVRWLLTHQEKDGSWYGRWGVNYLYSTGSAVTALRRAGVPEDHDAVRRAVRWLTGRQNADGGWGEHVRSYEDPALHGRGASTPSQTAWALLALHAAGVTAGDGRVQRALAWLAMTQNADGSWDEETFTGTVLPRQFYMSYPMYRQLYPVMAIGRYSRQL
ncbi:squalene--hopene cyclase [Streptomyces avermitilis]|uniref:squalene--hopene cyclase n=1 Tax=Streptomyces avermitilis TaxID=33903 RepID=UPI0037F61569